MGASLSSTARGASASVGGTPQASPPEVIQAASGEASLPTSLLGTSLERVQPFVPHPNGDDSMEIEKITTKRLREASPPQSHKVDKKHLKSTLSSSKKSSEVLPEKTGTKPKQKSSGNPSLSRPSLQKSGESSKKKR